MRDLNWLRKLLCLALVACTVFTLGACQGPATPAACTHSGGAATCKDKAVCEKCGEAYGELAAHTYENGTCTVCGATEGGSGDGGNEGEGDGKPVPDSYADGAPVKGGGATIPEGSFALTATKYDESAAEEINANAFFRTAKRGEGKVFRVSDGKPVTVTRSTAQTYDGEGSILIAPQGVLFQDCKDLVVRNLIIIGSVELVNVDTIEMENVEIVSTEAALTMVEGCYSLLMNDCRLTGKSALVLSADDSVILNSYFAFTEKGIVDTSAEGTLVRNCILEGAGEAIRTKASESEFRSNTLTMGKTDTGIVVDSGVLNVLVALNDITGAQSSVVVGNGKNVAVVLNRGVSVTAENNSNLYICDNSLGGRITANNNNYFLGDGNTFPADEWTHATVQTGNKNHNGNNLMDVNYRPEVGAAEELLPHIDKDLFVGMARKEYVRDTADEKPMGIAAYILDHCKTDDYVIIAPGAYATESGMSFNAGHSDTVVYGYGVYMERQTSLGQMMNFTRAENITIKGLTIGFKQQSCGQVYVLEKLGSNQLRVVTGAGMMNEFGNTNTKYYVVTGMGAQRMGTFYAYCDTGFNRILSKNNKVEGVDTMIMEVSDSVYEMLAVGDILTCRANNGGTTIGIHTECKNIVFYDFNIYGNASGFAYVEQDARTATTYYRVCDTTRSGEIISEELYNQYKALEEKYGVNLEIEVDDLGRFRGSPAHIGSIDATHTTRCGEGSKATFCLFENMCDDATNQNATHGRLDEVIVNDDNTITLIYKGNFSEYSCSVNKWQPIGQPSGFCYNFKVGDRVYVYTSTGQLVCDTPALSITSVVDTVNFEWKDHGFPKSTAKGQVERRKVTVAADAVNLKALEGFNLKDNHWSSTNKVLIDNMSMSSNGFVFDNCKFQNIRSRGLLIKASGGTIQNCTFRNIGMSCGAILYEIYWGESGVTEDMLVDRNLFDHTGYFKNHDLYATIAVVGLGASVQEDFLLYKNITITNNKIINRTTDYAVYINSAKDVVIENNDFGPFVGNNFTNHPEEPDTYESPRPVIHINGAMNVKIAGNKYPNPDVLGIDYVVAEKNKNIYGSDVELDGSPLIPDND